jgi:predicted GH43/DUF377 family glycosyl hydrolase
MTRFKGNPILEPIGTHKWESQLVFNAAAFTHNKKIHLLYRAMGNDHISRIGYATSTDGYHIDERFPTPIFSPSNEPEKEGCEDPRTTLLDNSLIMAYTAFGNHDSQQVYQIGLTSIKLNDFLARKWNWGKRSLVFPGVRNKNGLLFPKKIHDEYILFHRLGLDVCIARSEDLKCWYDIKFVMGPRAESWDSWKVGTTGPPIELNEGWLFIYHGINYDKIYALGVALLDKNNPEKVIYRAENPILTPEKNYEVFGKVQNVVYSCGHVVIDDKILIYYGGADSVLCVATYDPSELLPKK